MSNEAIGAGIEHCEIDEVSNLWWETAAELVAKEEDLVEVGHLADGAGNATVEVVVGEGDDRDTRVSDGFGDERGESIVVQEYGIKVFGEEGGRDFSFEVIVPEIKELSDGPFKYDLREMANEAVVTDIELEHDLKLRKA